MLPGVPGRVNEAPGRGGPRPGACLLAGAGVCSADLHQPFRRRSIVTHQRIFGAAALTAAAVAVGLLTTQAEAQKNKPRAEAHDAHAEAFDHCAKACSDCQRQCDSCGTHCAHLLAGGKKEHLKTLQTCEDCATVCAAAAQIV